MTRRELLKSLGVLCLGLTVPTASTSSTAGNKPIKMVGIGWKGCHVADFFSKQGLDAEYIHINHSECEDETVKSADKIYYFHHPEILYINNEESVILSNELKSIFNPYSRFIIATKSGEKETTKFALAIINYLNEMHYDYFSIIYMPYGFEGTEKSRRARSVVNAINNPEMAFVTDMRSVIRKYGRYSIQEVTEILNRNAFEYFKHIVYQESIAF